MPVSKAQAQANPLRNIQSIDVGHHTWRVVMRRQHQHLRQPFTDSVYGGKEQALAAAVAFRDQIETELLDALKA